MNKKTLVLMTILFVWMATAVLISSYHPPDSVLLRQKREQFKQKDDELNECQKYWRDVQQGKQKYNPFMDCDSAVLKKERDGLERELNQINNTTWRFRLSGRDEDFTRFLVFATPAILLSVPFFFWFNNRRRSRLAQSEGSTTAGNGPQGDSGK